MADEIHNPECFANHMGHYAILPEWLSRTVDAIQAGMWPIVAAGPATKAKAEPPYVVTPDGVAVVPMNGPMMKGTSKYPHVNTLDTRRALRAAAADDGVRGILLLIDSPGGTVAGTDALAEEVRAVGKRKPVHAHGEDLVASAAYWVASSARRVTATRTTEVGSIGTVAVVADTSGAAELEGVKVHVVSTGALKGAFAPGTEVTDEQLEYLAGRVAAINGPFASAVAKGRGLGKRALAHVSDGRVWLADEALALGLVDAVESTDQAIRGLVESIEAGERAREARRARGRIARSRLGLSGS